LFGIKHPFFVELYELINKIESGNQDVDSYKRLKTLIDLLIISFSRSEASFEADECIPAEQLFEMLKSQWGTYLMSYMQTWNKNK
jgi:hypothetical protein